MAGRKKLPSNVKILKGTNRKSRENPNEPVPDTCIPDPPDFLSDYAMDEWNRITRQLENLNLISEMDMAALALYCQAWGRIEKYERMVAAKGEAGEIYKTTNGNYQLSPLMWVINKAYEQVYKFISEFGFSPASRARLSVNKNEKKQDNPFEKFG